MCLAIPAKIVSCDREDALAEVHGNRLHISIVMTPEVQAGDWVLVHAGFAVTRLESEPAVDEWLSFDSEMCDNVETSAGQRGAGP